MNIKLTVFSSGSAAIVNKTAMSMKDITCTVLEANIKVNGEEKFHTFSPRKTLRPIWLPFQIYDDVHPVR